MKKVILLIVLCLALIPLQGRGMMSIVASPKANTISLTTPSAMTVGDADQTMTCTSRGGTSWGASPPTNASYSSSNASYATIVSNKLHAVAAGSVTVTSADTGGKGWGPGVSKTSGSVTISAGGTSCSAATDKMGDSNAEAGTDSGSLDRIYVFRYQFLPVSGCSSGTFAAGYIYHVAPTAGEKAKVCVWNSGGATPAATDTLIACTVELSSGTSSAWLSNTLSGTATANSYYWVGFITGSNFDYGDNDGVGATLYYKTVSGAYASPPSLSTGFSSTTRTISNYVTVGP